MLKNKIVVITGGNGLLGREFCRSVSENNGIAIVADYEEKGQVFSKSLKNSFFCKMDITSESSIKNCLNIISKKYGKIDALVNNAYPRNKNYGRDVMKVDYNDFVENIGMNLGGYFACTKVFSKFFKDQGYGNVINIGSIYGVIAPKFEIYNNTSSTMPIEYSAIKAGIIHMTKYFAKYFKNNSIRFNCISPGGILDSQSITFIKQYNNFCLNKGMLNCEDISGSLIFLLSDLSKSINGQNIIVDDGFTL